MSQDRPLVHAGAQRGRPQPGLQDLARRVPRVLCQQIRRIFRLRQVPEDFPSKSHRCTCSRSLVSRRMTSSPGKDDRRSSWTSRDSGSSIKSSISPISPSQQRSGPDRFLESTAEEDDASAVPGWTAPSGLPQSAVHLSSPRDGRVFAQSPGELTPAEELRMSALEIEPAQPNRGSAPGRLQGRRRGSGSAPGPSAVSQSVEVGPKVGSLRGDQAAEPSTLSNSTSSAISHLTSASQRVPNLHLPPSPP